MLEQLGSVPKGGEVVEIPGWRYTVVDVEKNRISKVKIERVKEAPAPAPVAVSASSSRTTEREAAASKKQAT
jgi:Mg2+/Co2+ transporter CorC